MLGRGCGSYRVYTAVRLYGLFNVMSQGTAPFFNLKTGFFYFLKQKIFIGLIIFFKIKTRKLLFLLFLFFIFASVINSSFFFFRGKTWEPRENRGLSRNCERRSIPARILSHRHIDREGRVCGGAESGDRPRKQHERQGAFAKKAHLSPQRPP